MSDVRAGIYARISSDAEHLGLGVQRQVEDCRAEAARRGWAVAAEYIDNDVSATRSKVRPQYERMLADAQASRITGILVWDVDRLTRTPRELEDVIDLADRHGLALASVGGEIDLSTPQGRMTARIKGTVARHETEQQSRRLKRKFLERAEAGKPHSFAAYGYTRRPDGGDALHPEQAAVIRDVARQLLAGESLRSVVAGLNARGVVSPRGLPWSSAALRQVMVRARNAGLRTHLGQVIGRGDWPAILDEDTHTRLVALLSDPNRRTNRGATRKHLLSGIARCGRCGGGMVVNVGRASRGKTQPPAYMCRECFRVRRKQADVDRVVEAVIVARLSQPDAVAALAEGDPAEVEALRAGLAAIEARLAVAADQFADGELTGDQLRRITGRLRPQLEEGRAKLAAATPSGALELAGVDAGERWAAASLDVRRAVIEALATVTVLPAGTGARFDPTLIRIEWR